jgi:hypothetical protein
VIKLVHLKSEGFVVKIKNQITYVIPQIVFNLLKKLEIHASQHFNRQLENF